MTPQKPFQLIALSTLTLATLVACPSGEVDSNPFTSPNTSFPTPSGDGDGDTGETGETTPGDGDGDGDGDPTGDGDGDPTGDGDGDPTGDGDGDPPAPTCDDGIQNQDETDIDCGGATCATCPDGDMCDEGSDCDSNMCVGNLCVSGCLGDVECDYLASDCMQGICNIGVCEAYPANEDDDCVTGEICKAVGACTDGVCIEDDLDCTEFDSDCSMGVCDLDTGECVMDAINEGMPCAGAVGCSSDPYCTDGECDDPNGGALFYDEFADNSNGWTLDTNWAIGSTSSVCGDPASDHSPSDNNGVAGVVLGGCAPAVVHAYYCLTSPVIDTAGENTLWMTYYRDLWSDYTPYMKNILSVYNGNSWVTLFETFGSPGIDDGNWMYFAYDVSAHANANMRFRWCYNIQSGGVFDRGSWNVDDVTVSLSECNGADE